MRVDLPSPDSPGGAILRVQRRVTRSAVLTDDHACELETFPDALPVYLVGQVGETDIAHERFADDGWGAGSVAERRA